MQVLLRRIVTHRTLMKPEFDSKWLFALVRAWINEPPSPAPVVLQPGARLEEATRPPPVPLPIRPQPHRERIWHPTIHRGRKSCRAGRERFAQCPSHRSIPVLRKPAYSVEL